MLNIYVDTHCALDCNGETIFIEPIVNIQLNVGDKYNMEVLKDVQLKVQNILREGLNKAIVRTPRD